jgi:rhamnosyltransferase
MNEAIGIVIPTLNAERCLSNCLSPLLSSALKPRILVVDSSSTDNTVAMAKRLGVEVLVVPHRHFNHGLTREHARKILNTEIVVMMTQDACATSQTMLEKLIEPITNRVASVSYARQIPRDGAGILESFSRLFNYPEASHIRGIEDVERYGVYIFFCSNSCAAYRNSALDEISGFPAVLTAEDAIVVAKLLKRGHKIAYVADAVVKHSHRHTLLQEFRRYFDMGYIRRENQRLFSFGGKDEDRGREYFVNLMRNVLKAQPLLLPYALLQTLAKWAGYQAGFASLKAPLWLKKNLSAQNFFRSSTAILQESPNSSTQLVQATGRLLG